MTHEECKVELRKAEKALRKARKDAANGLPVSVHKAGELVEYWLHKTYMAWERTPVTDQPYGRDKGKR